MSNVPFKDADDNIRRMDVFTRTEGSDVVETQAVALVDPSTGTPLALATQATVAALLTAAEAIQAAAEALNAKATAINTGAIAGTVALDAPSLAALETINVSNMVAPGLTNAELRAAPVPITSASAYEEDTAHVSGAIGNLMLAIRSDNDAPTADNGDYTILKMDEEGRLKVASKPASYPDVVGNITAIQPTINTAVAGGTVTANVSRASNVMAFCTGTFAGANNTFEGSLETTGENNWFGVQAVRSNANTIETATGALSAAPAYAWEMSVNALARVRVRCTALTSGAQAWRFKLGTYATEPIPAAQVTAAQPVTINGGTSRAGFVGASGIWYDDSSTALAAGASFTGALRDLANTASAATFASNGTYADEVRVSAESDQAGTLWMEVSRDNGATYRRVKSVPTAAVAGGGQYAEIIHSPSIRYVRFGFTNGATLQTRFLINSILMAA